MTTPRKILVICRHAPYGQPLAREAIDAVLASAAFDQDVRLLFMADGVWQLHQDQQGKAIAQKSVSALLSALPLYGVDQLYVHDNALTQRGLTCEQLCLPVELLNDQEIGQFINQHDTVLSF